LVRQILAIPLGVLLDRFPAALYPATQHLRDLVVRGLVAECDVSVLEVCEDGGEEQRARRITGFARFVHRGAQPLQDSSHLDRPNAPVLAARGVHLALFPLTGLLVVAVLAEVRENPGLLALFLEALECPFETLVIVDDDFRHLKTHLFSGAEPGGYANCGRHKKLPRSRGNRKFSPAAISSPALPGCGGGDDPRSGPRHGSCWPPRGTL